jgi:hypothetical protein
VPALLKRCEAFIDALAHVAMYIGHQTSLFPATVNSSAIVSAAQRRWDQKGKYSWHISDKLSRTLTQVLLENSAVVFSTEVTTIESRQQDQLRSSSSSEIQGGHGRRDNPSVLKSSQGLLDSSVLEGAALIGSYTDEL